MKIIVPPAIRLEGDKDKARALFHAHAERLWMEFRRLTGFQSLQQNDRRVDFDDGSVILMQTRFGQGVMTVFAPPGAGEEEKPWQPLCWKYVWGPENPRGFFSGGQMPVFMSLGIHNDGEGIRNPSGHHLLHGFVSGGIDLNETNIYHGWVADETQPFVGNYQEEEAIPPGRSPTQWVKKVKDCYPVENFRAAGQSDGDWFAERPSRGIAGENLLLAANATGEGAPCTRLYVTFYRGDSILNRKAFLTVRCSFYSMYWYNIYPQIYPSGHTPDAYPVPLAQIDYRNGTVHPNPQDSPLVTVLDEPLDPWAHSVAHLFHPNP